MRIVRDSWHIWSWLVSPYVSWLISPYVSDSWLILSILIRVSFHPYPFVTHSIHNHLWLILSILIPSIRVVTHHTHGCDAFPSVQWLVTRSIHTHSWLILSILIRNSFYPYSFVTHSIHTHSIHVCRFTSHVRDSSSHLCGDSWLIPSIPIRDSFYPYSFVSYSIDTHSIHICRDSSLTCHDTHDKFVTHALTITFNDFYQAELEEFLKLPPPPLLAQNGR